MKQQEEEYNYGWKVIEVEFHRRADELFDFQLRQDWNLEPTWRMNTNIPPPIRIIKKRNDEKVDFDCPDRGRDSADRIVAYQ